MVVNIPDNVVAGVRELAVAAGMPVDRYILEVLRMWQDCVSDGVSFGLGLSGEVAGLDAVNKAGGYAWKKPGEVLRGTRGRKRVR